MSQESLYKARFDIPPDEQPPKTPPTRRVFAVIGPWNLVQVGVAAVNPDGTIDVDIGAMPKDGRLIIDSEDVEHPGMVY